MYKWSKYFGLGGFLEISKLLRQLHHKNAKQGVKIEMLLKSINHISGSVARSSMPSVKIPK